MPRSSRSGVNNLATAAGATPSLQGDHADDSDSILGDLGDLGEPFAADATHAAGAAFAGAAGMGGGATAAAVDYEQVVPLLFYAAAGPLGLWATSAGYDPLTGLFWAAKFLVLLVVSFIEKWTLYTYSYVGAHGGGFFEGAGATYALLSSDLGLLLGNAYAGDAVAAALVLAALPLLGALAWVLLGDAGTPLNLNVDAWALFSSVFPAEQEQQVDVAAVVLGGGLALVALGWCLPPPTPCSSAASPRCGRPAGKRVRRRTSAGRREAAARQQAR